jgi:predicted amidohydrolase
MPGNAPAAKSGPIMMSGARRATTVACCQVSLRVGALEANREACRRAAERAAGDGAQIIVLPELAASGYVFTPGSEEPPVVDVGEARLAVMVCYDLEFPEWVRIPALAGAQLLCVPTNWPSFPRPAGERPMEVVRAQAAASVNRMYVAACDRAGPERGVDWVGASVIFDPDGWPLAGPLDDQEGTIMAACQLETATDKKISEHNDVLGDRRPGLYHRVLGESRQAREGGSR